MTEPVPTAPEEIEAAFEPSNEAKDARNRTAEFAVGDTPPEADPPEADPPEDNHTPGAMPPGDEEQTPTPEYWRDPPYAREPLEGLEDLDQNDINTLRNMRPEIVIGAPSADILEAEIESAPVVKDAPYVSQTDDMLTCTMGNWYGEPDSRTYQWQSNGVDVTDATEENYIVAADDIGQTFTCVQTATNTYGTSDPVTSNEIVVAAPEGETEAGQEEEEP